MDFKSVWNWKYQYTRSIYWSIIELTMSSKSPDYKAVLEIDRKIRGIPMPPTLDILSAGYHSDVSPGVYMQAGYLAVTRSISMIHIHRNFFAQALLDHPENPLLSPYATSFLTASSCASSIIRTINTHISKAPDLVVR